MYCRRKKCCDIFSKTCWVWGQLALLICENRGETCKFMRRERIPLQHVQRKGNISKLSKTVCELTTDKSLSHVSAKVGWSQVNNFKCRKPQVKTEFYQLVLCHKAHRKWSKTNRLHQRVAVSAVELWLFEEWGVANATVGSASTVCLQSSFQFNIYFSLLVVVTLHLGGVVTCEYNLAQPKTLV